MSFCECRDVRPELISMEFYNTCVLFIILLHNLNMTIDWQEDKRMAEVLRLDLMKTQLLVNRAACVSVKCYGSTLKIGDLILRFEAVQPLRVPLNSQPYFGL